MKKLLLIMLIAGCVQPGIIRPNPDLYALQIPGLLLVKSQGLAMEDIGNISPCHNHDTVLLYYSEFNNTELSNYAVRITLNESRIECLKGEENESVYYYSNLTEQYAWISDKGLVLVEGTYSGLGSVEYNQTLLDRVIKYCLNAFPPKDLKPNSTSIN